jgi:6-pyruvoyltetrahydropterin/6-carboxytetrahydropterin synthase
MITCTRKIAFDAAHRVMEHESKCKHLHGHRYVIEATFASDGLDALGRVVDFGVIKEKLGVWIDTHWDHNTILFNKDEILGEAISNRTDQDVYYMNANPTAENMAQHLLEDICPKLFIDTGIRCINIRLWETPNCYADANVEREEK